MLEDAFGGPLPDGFETCHVCDNPTCTKNDDPGIYVINGIARPRFGHLWLGTHVENVADMWNKGRGQRGSRGSQAILSEEQVREILNLLSEGRYQHKIALQFQVARGTIASIAQGRSWRHIPRF